MTNEINTRVPDIVGHSVFAIVLKTCSTTVEKIIVFVRSNTLYVTTIVAVFERVRVDIFK